MLLERVRVVQAAAKFPAHELVRPTIFLVDVSYITRIRGLQAESFGDCFVRTGARNADVRVSACC
jgi:hypothetical protein